MSRANRWFVSGEGISREVITADIQRYLGPDAVVEPGVGTDPNNLGAPGYYITAYRTLTSQMIQDLKMDSQRWQLERRSLPSQRGPSERRPDTLVGLQTMALTHPSPFEIAESCGWQVGRSKFTAGREITNPPTKTDRGTLGKGGFGIVEEVAIIPDRPMVQKRVHIPRRKEQAQRYRAMITDEINNLKGLNHEHIVKILGSYEERQGLYDLQVCILMWPAGDQDLGIFLEEIYPNASHLDKSSIYIGWIRSWFTCLASALHYMHLEGVHHEDIKPTNIIHRGGEIYFTDFSSSRKLKDRQQTSTSSPALATRLFAAPEAMLDEEGNASRHGSGTDVYSLGLVFFEMLAVLNDYVLDNLRDDLFDNGPRVRQYHKVMHRVGVDLEIFTMVDLAELYNACVSSMLHPQRQLRPAAQAVAQYFYFYFWPYAPAPCSCWTGIFGSE